MASLHKFCHISELSTRLLSVSHIFQDYPTSLMKICQPQKYQHFSTLHSRKLCNFQNSDEQPFFPPHFLLAFPSRALCSKKVYLVHKCSLWSHQNITKRNTTSQQISHCRAQISNWSNPDIESRPFPQLKNSLAIEDDELMFLDKFMQFNDKDKVATRTNYSIPVQKYYFSPTNKLAKRTPEEIQNYLNHHNIRLNKTDTPPPIIEFDDVVFPEAIMKLLKEQYTAPTPIQAMGWSLVLSGKDVRGIGQTGSGKTLAYVLPALLHTAHQQQVLSKADSNFNCHSPVAVVLAPSRELATQVARVSRRYSAAVGVEVLLTTGGVKKEKHLNAIWSTRPKFLVATPGRLLDLLRCKQVLLNHCSFLVLDEADRMLDMGFEAQIRSIVQQIRSDRQTVMWSATWPSQVQQLASSIMLEDAVQLTVGTTELRANPDIEQHVHVCEFLEKTKLLTKLLREMLERDPEGKALVFVQSKRDISKLYHKLHRNGFNCDSLHGDLDQPMRDSVLAGFRKGRFSTLIATDVAARGLDIQGLSCVINYDFPHNIETYIHRIGRTGRCGQRGVAHTFFSQCNISKAPKFVQLLRETGQKVDNRLVYMAAKSVFLPESKKEIFLSFVPQKTSEGHKRSQSLMGGRSGKLLGPLDPKTLTPHQFVKHQLELKQQAKLQAKLAKKDKSKIVNTKYCIQEKR
ncbi:DEAD/DEAH box helicase domain [Trinorchestia longiramus]|nr:DEAD/DEAH box helicase domain [Trinorchestia longiramus]